MSSCTWAAQVERRGPTVVVLVRGAGDAAGELVKRALAATVEIAGVGALLVGPFWIGKLAAPAWYGRVGRLGVDEETVARMAQAAVRELRAAGCLLEGAPA